jgi:hypothetical protein
MLCNVIAKKPNHAVNLSVGATSVSSPINCSGADAIHVVNTSTTLYVTVEAGSGAQTATLNQSVIVPPMGQIFIEANDKFDTVAAIASGAGPTIVGFAPILRGQSI